MPPTAPGELLRAKLKLKQLEARKSLLDSRPRIAKLISQKKGDLDKIGEHSAKLLAGAAVTGSLLLSNNPINKTLGDYSIEQKVSNGLASKTNISEWLKSKLESYADRSPGHLPSEDETKVSIAIRSAFGLNAFGELDGHRLNHSIGFTGYEQHLQRFPGDTLDQHDEERVAGIAPGRGGWGYFTNSKSDLTQEDILREKYYFAVQTLYLPDWNTKTKELSNWYKYRKMIMINVNNGKAVVGVVGDAGPAGWTGKQFGASPEAMKELDLHLGGRKGKVILYFVDDPENTIPLGPIDHNLNQTNPIRT